MNNLEEKPVQLLKSVEDQRHAKFESAMSEQERLLQEMNDGNADNLVELIAQMNEAVKKSSEAWKAWKQAMSEAHQQEVE